MAGLTENVIAGSAALIALAALGYSIYEGRLARAHARLSVRPRLDVSLRVSPAFNRFALTVKNRGLGPAIIVKHDYTANGKNRDQLRDEDGVTTWNQLSTYLSFPDKLNWGYFPEESIIQPGEEEELVGCPTGDYTPERAKQFRQAIRKLVITLQYQSLYADELLQLRFDGMRAIAEEL